MKRGLLIIACLCVPLLRAQEAASGFDVRATVTGLGGYSQAFAEPPRSGMPFGAGASAILYPTWKLSRNWSISGAIQLRTRPFYYDEFTTQGYGAKVDVLRLNLAYSRFWDNRSVVVRVGQLSSAFGSFLDRYDATVNPLIDIPVTYGYYGAGVSLYGLAGAQVDATFRKLDVRAQFTNSSPSNPRSIFARDQYANWTGGVGYTIVQGFRVGASAYRGPYLDRHSQFYFPGEAKPHDLPATAVGLDVEWGRGPWNAYGELQHFVFDYHLIPVYRATGAYGEVRRVLNARWFAAARIGVEQPSVGPRTEVYETAIAYRTNRFQLVKIGYELQRFPGSSDSAYNTLAIQFVTNFNAVTVSR